jgi:hypothetical protein
MCKPITPEEVIKLEKPLPTEVLEAFNQLIVSNFSDGKAVIKQAEVEDLICEKLQIKPVYKDSQSRS